MKNKKREVTIDKEKCKGCALCVWVCPMKVLSMSEDVNRRGLSYAVMDDPSRCTGCGLCYTICPDCGIEVRERRAKSKGTGK